MPKGFHYGRTQTRAYTTEYHQIKAIKFKTLLSKPLGKYSINAEHLGDEHQKFTLAENKNGVRFLTFTINDKPHHIALKLDNSSISNKLYLCCPYCQKQRQSLYAIKQAYACRQCIGLHYASQSEREHDRLARRIRKQRANLWGCDYPDRMNLMESSYWWPKPKWMRWKTFKQKRDEIKELEDRYWHISRTQLSSWFGNEFEHLLME